MPTISDLSAAGSPGPAHRRSPRRLVATAAVAVAMTGLSACGSSGSSSSAPTTAPTTATTATPATTAPGAASSLASQGDALCSEIGTARTDLGQLDLSKPSSIGSAPAAIGNDLKDLQATASGISGSGQSGAKTGPIAKLVSDAESAVHEAETGVSQLADANVGDARTDFSASISDLEHARSEGSAAKLRACS